MQKKIIFTLALCIYSVASLADEAAHQLLAILRPLQTIQAQFSQTILDKEGRVLEQTQGQMALLRPGKLRWETQKPTHQLLIADGKKIWLYDESLKQVTVQPQSQKTASPVMLLSDPTAQLMSQFTIHSIEPSKGQRLFTLIPNDKSAIFKEAKLSFVDGLLTQMYLRDHLGQMTKITFDQVKINILFHSAVFTFVTPKGADVVVGQGVS